MRVKLELDLEPFPVPEYVKQIEKLDSDEVPNRYPLSSLPAEALERLCDDFIVDVFTFAGKRQPDKEATRKPIRKMDKVV